MIIYHNPRCSKSRQALQILEKSGQPFEVVEYLLNPPSSIELADICSKLNVTPIEMIRTGEAVFKALGLSKSDKKVDDEWFAILAQHPQLIQRPIVVSGDKAIIGRPPEQVNDLLLP